MPQCLWSSGVLQCVAVCCIALKCVSGFAPTSAFKWCVQVCFSVFQCVAVCCSVSQHMPQCLSRGVLHDVAVWSSVVQCDAVCCSVLQYVSAYAIISVFE